MISEFWRPEHLLVLEFSPRVDVAGVKASQQRILDLMR
jgi:hypothetical protein